MDYLEDKDITPSDFQKTISSLSNIIPYIFTKLTFGLIKRFLTISLKEPFTSYNETIPYLYGSGNKILAVDFPILNEDVIQEVYSPKGDDLIKFQALTLNLNYNLLSDDTFDMILTLDQFENEDIFRLRTVSFFIDYCWERTVSHHIKLGVLFSTLMILLSAYVSLDQSNIILELAITACSVLVLIYEILQMYVLRKTYFTSPWNWTDIIFSILVLVFMFMRIMDIDSEFFVDSGLYLVCLLIGYLRWVSYLRLFSSTSKNIYDLFLFS